eukprot:CAMPEP_0180351900 /NCGR_PEP_ID=MMETSP0989-20121125/6785_1 /TAXON_ID=697907 /ORGANISM="non described non described, Strain CCMP2293" /LENGTH=76 /DNA_ID=CAMNT_0022341393 /DNA_START=51 /DNA_END=281 /DNA_ORIENTATION=-
MTRALESVTRQGETSATGDTLNAPSPPRTLVSVSGAVEDSNCGAKWLRGETMVEEDTDGAMRWQIALSRTVHASAL